MTTAAVFTVAPAVLMLVPFIFVPALNATTVGIMVPVGVVFTLVVTRILYKKGPVRGMVALYITLAPIVIFLAVILIRAAVFRPAPLPGTEAEVAVCSGDMLFNAFDA